VLFKSQSTISILTDLHFRDDGFAITDTSETNKLAKFAHGTPLQQDSKTLTILGEIQFVSKEDYDQFIKARDDSDESDDDGRGFFD